MIATMALLTVSEASARFDLSGRRIRTLLLTKAVSGSKVATVWLVDEDSLKAYIATRPRPGRPKKRA